MTPFTTPLPNTGTLPINPFGNLQSYQAPVPHATPAPISAPVPMPVPALVPMPAPSPVVTPAPPPPPPAPDPGLAGMPPWLAALEAAFLPPQKNSSWIPTFAPRQYVSEPNNSGGMASQPLRTTDFPTLASAQWLQAKYAPSGTVITLPFPGVGGPDQSATGTLPPSFALLWQNGVAIYASVLAAIWFHNPATPDAADNVCVQLIAGRGAK